MRNRIFVLVLAVATPAIAVAAGATSSLTVSSPAFTERGPIPATFSCDGKGQSPPLEWSDVPPNTRSIALIVDDPDAPNGTYAHWLVFNLPPTTRGLLAGTPPPGASIGVNSDGKAGYQPMCPPSGLHHYRFQVFALDRMMPMLEQPNQAKLEDAISGHVLARGLLIGTYHR
jgi:Raf kinase inhibitor-like YbhB/YbcL family protein